MRWLPESEFGQKHRQQMLLQQVLDHQSSFSEH